jgi:hypothetical protein
MLWRDQRIAGNQCVGSVYDWASRFGKDAASHPRVLAAPRLGRPYLQEILVLSAEVESPRAGGPIM